MKTIKRERQVRLDELIKHCIDNDTFGCKGVFTSTTGKVNVTIYKDDVVIEDAYTDFNITKTFFTITEEVEITEDTKLDLVDIYKDYGLPLEVAFCNNTSVKEILKLDKESKIDTKFIHIKNPDGSIGDLIWLKERGLVD